ncbi:MAG: AraC family transcriptional regulator [Cyanobacteria bacterium P01_A01_bin.40]
MSVYPKLPRLPLITSENEPWNGIYLQHDRQPAFEITEHSHSQHTLIIGLENELQAEWSIDGRFKELQYNQGDIFIVPAHATHRAYWKRESESLMLAIEPDCLVDVAVDSINSDRLEIIPQFATNDLRLSQIARWLLTELREKQAGSNLYSESLIAMLMIHLLRNYTTKEPKFADYKGGLARHKLRIAIAFINDNLDRGFKLAEIASLLEMSPYHFGRMFKQSVGMTPHQYLVQQRLTKAKELLRCSSIAIADIGHMVGYKNSSHFSKVFHQHLKLTPKAYRQAL